jgi:transcriptional regulator with XRE-family HTH domain
VGIALPELRRLRLKAALSLRELAARSDIAYSTIARIETGKTANMRTVRQLAQALECSPEDLYGEFGRSKGT